MPTTTTARVLSVGDSVLIESTGSAGRRVESWKVERVHRTPTHVHAALRGPSRWQSLSVIWSNGQPVTVSK